MTLNKDSAIALIDCNNFYVSCERAVNPSLQHRPVVVLSHNDGIIISRSDEVKALGVPNTAPYFQYRELLERNNTAVISANHATYYEFSHRVTDLLTENLGAKKIEVYSIDEAFADVGVPDKLRQLGRQVKDAVYDATKIPVSVGIARTKTLAKLANHIAKKSPRADGVLDLFDSPFIDLALSKTAVGSIWGIGPRSALHLNSRGIKTAWDLKTSVPDEIRHLLNQFGARTVLELNGVKCLAMEVTSHTSKSISHTRTFGRPIHDYDEVKSAIFYFATRALEKMRWNGLSTARVEVSLKTDRFRPAPRAYHGKHVYRSTYHSDVTSEIYEWIGECLHAAFRPGIYFKKAGVKFSDLIGSSAAENRLFEHRSFERRHLLAKTIDELNFRYGRDIVRSASLRERGGWQGKSEHRGNDAYHQVGRDVLGRGKTMSRSLRFL